MKTITSLKEFEDATAADAPVLIDFFATWCGPCKMMEPTLHKLDDENADIEFYKVDVDEVPDVAAKCGIRAMPTFQLYRSGQKVKEILGARVPELRKAVEELKA